MNISTFECIDCGQELESNFLLKKHMKKCPSLFKKCRWVHLDGRKCKLRGQYFDFCKRHCIPDYEYTQDGIKTDGDIESCGHVKFLTLVPSSIKIIQKNSEHTFIGRGGIEYEYVKNTLTTVTMKIVGTNDNIIFWKDKESRGNRAGHLIRTLKTKPFDSYCEKIAVCKIGDDEFYCEECFCSVYKCRINTLQENKKNLKEDTLDFENLKI